MSLDLNKPHRLWPSWYRGDFHAHTNHSDGSLSPKGLLAEAREKKLDFFSMTDHNVTSPYDEFGEHDDMLIIPGIEVTMKYGHFNVFGVVDRNHDWLTTLPKSREEYEHHMTTGEAKYTPNELMAITKSLGLFNSINHPLLGVWTWLDHETDLRNVDFIEIWNDPSWPENDWGNPDAVALWTRMLNAGHRLTAIGGTDFHHAHDKPQKDGSMVERDHLNLPTTYVYANQLSGVAILQGLVNHHAYMTMGPVVAFGATVGDKTYMIGDDMGDVDGAVTFRATVQADEPVSVELVHNGSVLCTAHGSGGEVGLALDVDLVSDMAHWFRIDVRDKNGRFLSVTNPIYAGQKTTPTLNTFGDFVE